MTTLQSQLDVECKQLLEQVDDLRERKAKMREKVEVIFKEKEEGKSMTSQIEYMEQLKDEIQDYGNDLQNLNLIFKKIFVRFLSYKDNTDVIDNYENNLNQLLGEQSFITTII